MKYLFLLVFSLFLGFVHAQDKLILYNNDTMVVKVLRLEDTTVHYTLPGNASQELTIPQAQVYRIRYENNTTLTLWNGSYEKKEMVDTGKGGLNYDAHAMFLRGMDDAQTHYKKYKDVFVLNYFCGLIEGVPLGIICPIVCANVNVATKRLNYPDKQLFANADYERGYRAGARRLKLKHVWPAYAAGLTTEIVAIVVDAVIITQHNNHH